MVPRSWRVSDISQALLEAALWDDCFKIPESAFFSPSREDRVIVAAPSLLDRIDHDGLLGLAGVEAKPHGIFYGDLALHYHQFLWRSFTSYVHYGLVSMILRLARSENVEARLAIDARRLRYRGEYRECFEADYWYGPTLDDDRLDDPNMLGLAIHGNPTIEHESSLTQYLATAFRWKNDGAGLKSIEIEELIYTPANWCDPVVARYLHSIRDTTQRVFSHCDGAVKGYELSGYPQTTNDFRDRGKSAYYRKVFRLDGHILTHDWSEVVSQWFRGNTLVLEYLSSLGVQAASPPQ